MLVHLSIRDFAIIDAVDIAFPRGFSVVTGETGAGKSILVDALCVALGGRASSDLVRAGAQAAQVEALFDISQQEAVKARLACRDLRGDDENVLLIRRVVSAGGARGRAKVVVNGRLSTRASLAEIVRGLVDISGQHEQQSLLHEENHRDLLDAFAQLEGPKKRYGQAFATLVRRVQERERLLRHENSNVQRADFLRFQLDEIDCLQLEPDEDVVLEAERAKLFHAEKLRHGVEVAEALLYSEDGSTFDKLGKAVAELSSLTAVDRDLGPLVETLDAARCDLEDAARSLQRYAGQVEVDPARLDEVETRLHALQRLCRKHGGSLADVIRKRHELACELESLSNVDARLAGLGTAIAEDEACVLALGTSLTEARREAADRLCMAVEREVADMDLPQATFRVSLQPLADGLRVGSGMANAAGFEDVAFLWSANLGEPPKPLARIASGGELSRLMLAVKGILSRCDLVSLYVFDEVDTGLGGRAAGTIGRKIQEVARDHQAITITHLAPIAARADHHLLVSKRGTQDERTVSTLSWVEGDARTEEVARMIDGGEVGSVTRQAAEEMLLRGREDAA